MKYLTFFLGDEEFGLDILEAREIVRYPALIRVPSMSTSILGVMNLRGGSIPVVDLAAVIGQPERPITPRTAVLVASMAAPLGGETRVGFVVERMSQVVELQPKDLEPPPTLGTREKPRYVRALGHTATSLVLLLDLPRVLEHVDLDLDPDALAALADAPADAGASSSLPPMKDPDR